MPNLETKDLPTNQENINIDEYKLNLDNKLDSTKWPSKHLFFNDKIDGKVVKKLTFFGHVSLTASLIGLVIASHALIYITAAFWQNDWLTCDIKKNQPFFTNNPTPQQIRLNQQFETIQDLTSKNCKVMAFFYKQYFICLSIGGTAALIAFLCIFFLSKEGWQKSNNALVNLSVTAFGVTTFYLNLTQIFQQDQNLKASQDLYANYSALRNNFASSLVLAVPKLTKQDPQVNGAETTKQITYSTLIQNTDNKLNELGFIRLGFDPTSITETQNKANSIFSGNTFQNLSQNPKPSLSKP